MACAYPMGNFVIFSQPEPVRKTIYRRQCCNGYHWYISHSHCKMPLFENITLTTLLISSSGNSINGINLPWLLQKLCMVIQYCPTIKMRSRRMKLAPLVDIFVECELIACMVGLAESGRKAYNVAEKTLTSGNLVTSYIYIYWSALAAVMAWCLTTPRQLSESVQNQSCPVAFTWEQFHKKRI